MVRANIRSHTAALVAASDGCKVFHIKLATADTSLSSSIMERVALIRGAGDVGSAVAHALARQGWRVVLHDVPAPAHPRRGVPFVDALFCGSVTLDGIVAQRINAVAEMRAHTDSASVAITSLPFEQVIDGFRPSVVVDARMHKRARSEVQRGLAPVTIGIGPGFDAGRTVDLVVESAWGSASDRSSGPVRRFPHSVSPR